MASLIQSTYSTPNAPGNFEAVVLEGNNLVHYYRDNSATGGGRWSPTAVITSSATARGSLIQSSYSTPNAPGNFEVVVLEGNNLVHYYRDNSASGGGKWSRTVVITSNATGPASLIQTNYSTPNAPGNLELVVPEGHDLVHYYRDDSASGGNKWYRGPVITSKLA